MYYRHSGYLGGLKKQTMKDVNEANPVDVLRRAVQGMLPKNKMRWQRLRRLRLFAGPEHVHEGDFKRSPSFHVMFPPDDGSPTITRMEFDKGAD